MNKSICVAAIINFVVVASSIADEPREKVASSAERIARARWQPIRQPLDESLEVIPVPEATSAQPMPAPLASGEFLVDEGIVDGEAMFDERYAEGDYYGIDDGMSHVSHGGCDGCGNCQGCRSSVYRGGWNPLFCVCVPTDGWFSAEYLMWWQKGMRLPPLVTTSSSTDNAAVLGRDSTSILFGGDSDHVDDAMSGMRFRLGFWLDPCRTWGIEGEHFGLETLRESFSASGNGSPIISRPFFNMDTNEEDAELVSFPDVVNGSVSVDLSSSLEGTAVHLRRLLGCGGDARHSHPVACRADTQVASRA
ncbi:MAG: BBP7 family outer membrane beta-barrel protein [Pirellulaceae bacterium]